MVSLSADLAHANYGSVRQQVVTAPVAVVQRAVVAAQPPSTAIWHHKHFWPALAILGLAVALLLVGAIGYWHGKHSHRYQQVSNSDTDDVDFDGLLGANDGHQIEMEDAD